MDFGYIDTNLCSGIIVLGFEHGGSMNVASVLARFVPSVFRRGETEVPVLSQMTQQSSTQLSSRVPLTGAQISQAWRIMDGDDRPQHPRHSS